MYDLGDTLPFSAKLYDKPPEQGGVLVNASAVTLTVTLPDGTAAPGVTVTNPPTVAGTYQYDYVAAAQAGRYVGRWLFTMSGGKTTSYVETFDVAAADPGFIVSLAEAKRALNKTSSVDDEELRSLLAAVTVVIERHTRRAILRRTTVERFSTGRYATRIVLSQVPVLSITTVNRLDAVQTWDPSTLSVDADTGSVTTYQGWFWGDIEVTYVAGMSVVPANYTEAAKIIVRHLWETQQEPTLARGPFGVDESAPPPPLMGFAIPRRALELLGGRAPLIA